METENWRYDFERLREVVRALLGDSGVTTIAEMTGPKGSEFRIQDYEPGALELDPNKRDAQLHVFNFIRDAVRSGEIYYLDDFEFLIHNPILVEVDIESLLLWFKNNPEKKSRIDFHLGTLGRDFPKAWSALIENIQDAEEEILPSQPEQTSVEVDEKETIEFLNNLRVWCENDIEILVQAPKKKPIICNPDMLSFRDDKTAQWIRLIALLKNPDGTFFYSKAQGAEKSAWQVIERKLRNFIRERFKLNISDNLKLFEVIKGKPGVRKPIFKVTKNQREDASIRDYSEYDVKEVMLEIINLAQYGGEHDTPNMKSAMARAREVGVSEDKIFEAYKRGTKLQDENGSIEGKSPYITTGERNKTGNSFF